MDELQRHIDETTRAAHQQHELNQTIINDHFNALDRAIEQYAALTSIQIGSQVARDHSENPTV